MTEAKYEPVRVRTIGDKSLNGEQLPEPRLESEKLINWHNSSDRKWLTNHLHWALLNGREIRLVAVSRSDIH